MNEIEERIRNLGHLIEQEKRPSTQLYYLTVLRQLQDDLDRKRP